MDQCFARSSQVLIIAPMDRNFVTKKSSDKRMRFPNEQTDCFADLRILKTRYFCIKYNKLVIQKFTDGNKLAFGRLSEGK
jgi:hypothetical protein